MALATLDYVIIIFFTLLILGVGLSFRNTAGKNIESFFLGGRNLPWWIAGTSMVATTFAADTPLAVTELVAQSGIAGNWLWWNMLAGGMLTTFFFAKYWRRANILTDVELVEIRYSGRAASMLRGFKAVYLGLFLNSLVIGWVNVALMSLIKVFFNIPDDQLLWYTALAMVIVVIYSATSGLLGVAFTDVIQFLMAMTGSIVLAFLVLDASEVSGIEGLKSSLPPSSFSFFPQVGEADVADVATTLSLSLGSFLAFIGIQWWASWYPGNEPGGGGYVAQRMMSAKNEKHAVYATLFFQIAHYCIRPWPWIIVALAALVLYPDLPADDKKLGYVMAMKDYLPDGLRGLLLVAFFAAYMSTISTQLNWGTSYLINDVYKRYIKPEATEKQFVMASRVGTLIVMLIALYATSQITNISGVWQFLMECGAGLGMVLILRWYWWRVNAWSEITAIIAPFVGYSVARYGFGMEFPNSFFVTVGFTTVAWIVVTLITQPTDDKVLRSFYDRIQPRGRWGPYQNGANSGEIGYLTICWLAAIALAYCILFFVGSVIFGQWSMAGIYLFIILVSAVILRTFASKVKIFDD